jgi:dihydrodipicolinate synthase/N-acetylneuraminate lyase
VAIKYAVVRQDARMDPYLDALLERVDRRIVISGIGERPAVTHLDRFALQGFTTGSGCLAPRMSGDILRALDGGDTARAEELRGAFIPLEDLRDRWGPARVIHAALELAGVARTGPTPPFVSGLDEPQRAAVAPVARQLLEAEGAHRQAR